MTTRRARGPLVVVDQRARRVIRKQVVGLTEFERQLLLKELAEIQAELDALQQRTADLTAQVADDPSPVPLDRPA